MSFARLRLPYFTSPGKVVVVVSALVERDEQVCACVSVLEREFSRRHLFTRCFYQIHTLAEPTFQRIGLVVLSSRGLYRHARDVAVLDSLVEGPPLLPPKDSPSPTASVADPTASCTEPTASLILSVTAIVLCKMSRADPLAALTKEPWSEVGQLPRVTTLMQSSSSSPHQCRNDQKVNISSS